MEKTKDLLAKYGFQEAPSPHFKHPRTSQQVMLHVIVALLFPTGSGIYFFGWRVLMMVIVGVATAVLFEAIFQKLANRPIQIKDGSAAVTGYLLALALPTTAPLWTLVVGTAFAIIIVKQLPGGIGRNRFNPAATTRTIMKFVLGRWITNWILPGPDVITTATPLEYIGHFSRSVPEPVPPISDLFFGFNLGGPVGETSTFILIFSFIYLVAVKVIKPQIPLIYLETITLWALLWGGFDIEYTLTHLLSGTVVFGAIFMITDYSSTPITPKGHEVFAFGAATITFWTRILFNLPGGFGVGVVIMNFFTPYIDKYFAPKIYGHEKAPQVLMPREQLESAKLDPANNK